MSKSKFSSRKFLMSLAAFLGSIGTSISGLVVGNEKLQIAGAVCAMVSTAIYVALEAYVDGKAVSLETSAVAKTEETK